MLALEVIDRYADDDNEGPIDSAVARVLTALEDGRSTMDHEGMYGAAAGTVLYHGTEDG